MSSFGSLPPQQAAWRSRDSGDLACPYEMMALWWQILSTPTPKLTKQTDPVPSSWDMCQNWLKQLSSWQATKPAEESIKGVHCASNIKVYGQQLTAKLAKLRTLNWQALRDSVCSAEFFKFLFVMRRLCYITYYSQEMMLHNILYNIWYVCYSSCNLVHSFTSETSNVTVTGNYTYITCYVTSLDHHVTCYLIYMATLAL